MARPLAHPTLYTNIANSLAADKNLQVKAVIAAGYSLDATLVGRYLRRARAAAGLSTKGRGSGVSVSIRSPKKWAAFKAEYGVEG